MSASCRIFRSPLLRVAGTLCSTKQRKSSQTIKWPLSFACHNNGNPITFVLVTEILINAVYKLGPIIQCYLQREMQPQLEHGEDAQMTGCNIFSPDLRAKNSLTLQLRLRLFLLHFTHFADEVGSGRPALYFRLIYDLCRGGCIRKISHVNLAPRCNNWP